MRKSLYAIGALAFLTLLLAPVSGVEWVEPVGLDPTINPQRVTAPAPVAAGNTVTAGPITPNQGGSPELGMPMMLEYVYIDPPLYTIWNYPWAPCASGMRFQTLWLKGDIGRPGKIHEMALYKSYYPSYYNGTWQNVTVKLCNTTVTNLGSSFSGNYGGATPVKVFHASSLTRGYQHGSDYWGWDTVDFDTDFDYDSSKSLLVEITWKGDPPYTCTYSWATYQSGKYHMAYYSGDTTSDYCYTAAYKFNTRIGFVPPANNVGVSKIIEPHDPFCAYGDTLIPVCAVSNYGSEAQSHVPVRCKINEQVSGTEVYNQVVYCDLAVGGVDTVQFPPYAPPITDMAYVDTMQTENPGDGRASDDMMRTVFSVTMWGAMCEGYNNGQFSNAISWVNWGWWATKYPQPKGGRCAGANFTVTSFTGADYAENIQLFGDDGNNHYPGTMFYDTAVIMHTNIWSSLYKNHFDFAAPIPVSYDSFFVSEYEKTWTQGGSYIYIGMCYVNPVPGVDYGNYQNRGWGKFSYGGDINFGIDYCYSAPLIDASCVDVSYPPATIDSNTTFQPVIEIQNTGLHDRKHVPYTFNIVTDTNTNDTLYKGGGDAGEVKTGQVKSFTLPDLLTPLPDHYTMTGITLCAYDYKYDNDTFAAPLFVRYYDVKTTIASPRKQEVPGLVPVAIALHNNGNVTATVPRVDVIIRPGTYTDYRENIEIAAGATQIVSFGPWVCPAGGKETCTAWITDASDMNHGTLNDGIWNDTAQQVTVTGTPGWTEMAPLPAPPSGKFVKDGGCMAYDALTDLIWASKGNKTGDVYAYHVAGDSWSTETTIPLGSEGKQVYKGSSICSDGNGSFYLTKGNNTVGFWELGGPLDAKAWTKKTDVPLGPSGKKVKQGAALVWAGSAKVGHAVAYLLKGYRNEFYRYDPATNAWTQLLDAPIGPAYHVKWDAGSWMVADGEPGGHLLYAFKAKYHEMYSYDTDADTWSSPKNAMPIPGSAGNKKAKDGSCAAWYNGKIYAFKGGNTVEFWRYAPLTDSWHTQVGYDIPLINKTGQRKKVKAGAALAGYPGVGIFAVKGNKSNEFWRFTPYDVVAGAQPSRDGITASTQIGSVSFAIAPNPLLGGFATVRYNLPKAGLATLNVFDVTGRTVLTQTLAAGRTGTASLDLRKLEAGVYLVKVATEGFSTTQKLVVEH
jgi:hypothetical protein